MNKIIRFVFLLIPLVLMSSIASAQVVQQEPEGLLEKLLSFWSSRLEMARGAVGADEKDFAVFKRFYGQQLDSMYVGFIKKVNTELDKTDNTSSVKEIMQLADDNQKKFEALYKKYVEVKKEYGSSVDEFKLEAPLPKDSCVAPCYNIGFEDGTLDGWYGYYAQNNSPTNAAYAGPYVINNVTGGYCGAVARAGGPDAFENNDYQIRVTSGLATDYVLKTFSTYSLPQVSPFGGKHSVMLGDSNYPEKGAAILSESFLVTQSTSSLIYQFAVFLERNPSHTLYVQPLFSVVILNQNGDTLPSCGNYIQSALTAGAAGYKKISYPKNKYNGAADSVYWKPWTLINVPLTKYIGQCVTIIFSDWDCSAGGHFGYAYVDAECSPFEILASSPNFCGQDSISLTAPPGDSAYLWSGPAIAGKNNTQTIWIKDSGTYQAIVYPVTGVHCADTLYIHPRILNILPPRAKFRTDTGCYGEPVQFVNLSSDTAHADFYWDFYNVGLYNDTAIVNPTWTYPVPGTYVTKLFELDSGCGAYFYDTIQIDSVITGGFIPSAIKGCTPFTVNFTNTTQAGKIYHWNFGDPKSAPLDTTSTKDATHTYNNPGTYTVSLIALNGGICHDTLTQVIRVGASPPPFITGAELVCPGGRDTLTATPGESSYLWLPGGQTTDSIIVTVLSDATYTCTLTDSCGSTNTVFNIFLGKKPVGTITGVPSNDTICSGHSAFFTASGGNAYKWSTGATSDTLTVGPPVSQLYTVEVRNQFTNCRDTAQAFLTVVPTVLTSLTLSGDSVCPFTPVTLSVKSSSGHPRYLWSTNSTTTTITVNPYSDSTYTVVVSGICAADTIVQKVIIASPSLNIDADDTVCPGSIILITATGSFSYNWSTGATSSTITATINSDTTFAVMGTVGNCSDSAKKKIVLFGGLKRFPTKDTVCATRDTRLKVAVNGGTRPYKYSWNNNISYDSAAITVPTPPYQYVCTITDGCGFTTSDTINIYANPSPAVSFFAMPDSVIPGGTFVNFVNQSLGASGYYWNLGDGTISTDSMPFHEYNVAGNYVITLIGTNAFGCPDTITRDLLVTEEIFVPNVFTPNADGVNDVFQVTAGSMKYYNIKIYNRWGDLIFESDSPNISWTGRSNAGTLESNGTYYYVIQATDYTNKNFNLDGYVQLIRGK